MASVLAQDTAGPLAVTAYRRVAEIIVCGIDRCDEEGCPLTQVQQVAITAVALGCVDGVQAELADLLTCDASLRMARPVTT